MAVSILQYALRLLAASRLVLPGDTRDKSEYWLKAIPGLVGVPHLELIIGITDVGIRIPAERSKRVPIQTDFPQPQDLKNSPYP